MNTPHFMLPPHSIEAEQSVLGGLLLAGADGLDRIEGRLLEEDFYRPEHQDIFRAIRSLATQGQAVDVITVADALERTGDLEKAGGLVYAGSLAQNVPSAANIKSYADIVRKHALQRRLLLLGMEMQTKCMAPGANVAEIINQVDTTLVQLMDNGTDEPVLLADCLQEVIQDIDNRATGHIRSGLQTGIVDFDSLTGGLEPGQLVVIAARPSVGKTALALNIANHVVQRGDPIAFFSLEMTNRELSQRLLALRTGISVSQMRNGQLEDEQWSDICKSHSGTERQPLFLIDRSSIGAPYVRAVARKIKRKHGLSLIVVDYLGLMKGEGQNRNYEIGSLSRGLKALAKELNVPVIVLAQLNRATEHRQDKRPQLSDLRDSGEIEQDADIVAMLHREEQQDTAENGTCLVELIIRKNRNGTLGELLLRYEGKQMRFSGCREGDLIRRSLNSPHKKGFN